AAMATFEEQTAFVAEALLSELFSSEDVSSCRNLETDSASMVSARELPTTFDPVIIASRLRRIGDQCNLEFEKVSSESLAEVLKGKLTLPSQSLQVEKFGAAVESISRTWSNQNSELTYERAFLSVSVKLLEYIAKKVPAIVNPSHLTQVINGNTQVRAYIERLGGWVRM
ncbi:B2L15 protein, partial [Upupa epops]|nr:B2L15 protein [Upupa epops]